MIEAEQITQNNRLDALENAPAPELWTLPDTNITPSLSEDGKLISY